MRVAAVILGAGIATIIWLRHTRRLNDPAPRWKPEDRSIYNNRSRR